MSRSAAITGRELEKLKADWQKSRKNIVLAKAVTLCADHRLREPRWLHDALYRVGRKKILAMKKMGRRTDLLHDDPIYAAVEHHLTSGLKQAKAFERTAQEFYPDATDDQSDRVKMIWLRHGKRITKFDPLGMKWRFKTKFMRNDKYSAKADDPLHGPAKCEKVNVKK